MQAELKAVIWDFGGVVTSSPFDAFARYEAERGLPANTIRQINATAPDSNAWARFERAAIDGRWPGAWFNLALAYKRYGRIEDASDPFTNRGHRRGAFKDLFYTLRVQLSAVWKQ